MAHNFRDNDSGDAWDRAGANIATVRDCFDQKHITSVMTKCNATNWTIHFRPDCTEIKLLM